MKGALRASVFVCGCLWGAGGGGAAEGEGGRAVRASGGGEGRAGERAARVAFRVCVYLVLAGAPLCLLLDSPNTTPTHTPETALRGGTRVSGCLHPVVGGAVWWFVWGGQAHDTI